MTVLEHSLCKYFLYVQYSTSTNPKFGESKNICGCNGQKLILTLTFVVHCFLNELHW